MNKIIKNYPFCVCINLMSNDKKNEKIISENFESLFY